MLIISYLQNKSLEIDHKSCTLIFNKHFIQKLHSIYLEIKKLKIIYIKKIRFNYLLITYIYFFFIFKFHTISLINSISDLILPFQLLIQIFLFLVLVIILLIPRSINFRLSFYLLHLISLLMDLYLNLNLLNFFVMIYYSMRLYLFFNCLLVIFQMLTCLRFIFLFLFCLEMDYVLVMMSFVQVNCSLCYYHDHFFNRIWLCSVIQKPSYLKLLY